MQHRDLLSEFTHDYQDLRQKIAISAEQLNVREHFENLRAELEKSGHFNHAKYIAHMCTSLLIIGAPEAAMFESTIHHSVDYAMDYSLYQQNVRLALLKDKLNLSLNALLNNTIIPEHMHGMSITRLLAQQKALARISLSVPGHSIVVTYKAQLIV